MGSLHEPESSFSSIHSTQNLISFGLGYANVDLSSVGIHSEVADYSYWDSLPAVAEGKFVRHVQVRQPRFPRD